MRGVAAAAGPRLLRRPYDAARWLDGLEGNDLAFDPAGNLYVPDDKPRIWRVTPDGEASIWFTDPRLTGGFPVAGGPLGGRIDASGEWLYFSITVSGDPEFPGAGVIYRLRLVDAPTAADLELVHLGGRETELRVGLQVDLEDSPPKGEIIDVARSEVGADR